VTVRDSVLLLPLLGDVDHGRAEQVMEVVLSRVVDDRARAIIIDVAGVSVMDTSVANALIRTAQAVSLLGAHTILTGIGPHASKTMVGLGIDLSAIHTRSRLTEGIDLALQLTERSALNPTRAT
jgi:rsbT co-antagonist protein RsbR